MTNVTPLFKNPPVRIPNEMELSQANFAVIIAKDNLKVCWQLYESLLDRYMKCGITAGLRKASDMQELALLELAQAQAYLNQLTGMEL